MLGGQKMACFSTKIRRLGHLLCVVRFNGTFVVG